MNSIEFAFLCLAAVFVVFILTMTGEAQRHHNKNRDE